MAEFPEEWGAQEKDGDVSWWRATAYTTLALNCNEALALSSLVARTCPRLTMVAIVRVQNRRWWRNFTRVRDEVAQTSARGRANERLLFHGTNAKSPRDVLASPEGLDVRFMNGGFYGRGVYLAEDSAYPVGGRYAHRVSGTGGRRLELLVVRAALGTQEEMGTRIDAATKKMVMPL